MTGVVLDASALLALLRQEPGGSRVSDVLDGAKISSVNWAEVAGHYTRNDVPIAAVKKRLATLPVIVISASATHAIDAAAMLPLTKAAGLSLGDRFCLALARAEGARALTTDRAWAGLRLERVEIEMIR